MTIKGESLKVKEQDVEFEGSIKNDEKHKDLTVFKINGSIGYIKVDNDMIYGLEKPNEKPMKEYSYKKINQKFFYELKIKSYFFYSREGLTFKILDTKVHFVNLF